MECITGKAIMELICPLMSNTMDTQKKKMFEESNK